MDNGDVPITGIGSPCAMKPTLLIGAFAVLAGSSAAQLSASPSAEPWNAEYAGQDAAGKHVLALWQFNARGENEDASVHGLRLELQGAKIAPEGRFGGCLESFAGWPVEDVRHRAWVKNDPRLSPAGAFTLEMWIRPKPEWKDYPDCFLLDKKYVAHDDYQLILGPADASGRRVLRACLGFGADSVTWYARPARFEPLAWHHVAFTYDGAGTGSFFVDGVPHGKATFPGREQISPGKHGLSIGDRVGSLYHGFPGWIDQVRICDGAREFRRVKVERISPRTCFVRMEAGAVLRLAVTNLQTAPLAEATVSLQADGMERRQVKIDRLSPGGVSVVEYPLDTRLRPAIYTVVARLAAAGREPLETQETFEIRLVPRQVPGRFPVVMWGVYGNVTDELPRLKAIGFIHALGQGAAYEAIWRAGSPTEPETPDRLADNQHMLDEALAADFSILASLSPGSWLRGKERFLRVDRQGKSHPDKKRADICGLFPEIGKFCGHVGASVGKAYGQFPAFAGALVHTEVRDQAYPCFHPHDLAAYRALAGTEIPPEAGGPGGVDYRKLPGFPASRVIPDDHPLYRYYRWYWKQGDGWNALNTAVDEGLKSAGGRRLWTFHDPAARVARVYGSGGRVDVLSQWTYSYPDPIRIGLATDELLALAAGAEAPQQVMKMTQIIWYRSQTAPQAKPGVDAPPPSAWEQQQPDAPFITIAPLHLREAFWTKIARPIRGIMYHGWQSLVPCEPATGYCYTHPQTQHELARLIAQVIRPLGPTLLEIPAAPGDVAFLESFASEMFARRGTYGWGGGWAGDAYHVLQYAHLQPQIVLDETITRRGLDGYRVLVMCDCDVITQSISRHQRRAGRLDDRGQRTGLRPACLALPAAPRPGVPASAAQTGAQGADRCGTAQGMTCEGCGQSLEPDVHRDNIQCRPAGQPVAQR